MHHVNLSVSTRISGFQKKYFVPSPLCGRLTSRLCLYIVDAEEGLRRRFKAEKKGHRIANYASKAPKFSNFSLHFMVFYRSRYKYVCGQPCPTLPNKPPTPFRQSVSALTAGVSHMPLKVPYPSLCRYSMPLFTPFSCQYRPILAQPTRTFGCSRPIACPRLRQHNPAPTRR